MWGALCRGRGVGPGPRGEFVDEVVACGEEFGGRDLPGGAEGRSVGDGGVGVAQLVQAGAKDVHCE